MKRIVKHFAALMLVAACTGDTGGESKDSGMLTAKNEAPAARVAPQPPPPVPEKLIATANKSTLTTDANLFKDGDLNFRLRKQNGLCLGFPKVVKITNLGTTTAILSGSDVSPYFKVDTKLDGETLASLKELEVKVRPCNHEVGTFDAVLKIKARQADDVGAVEVKLHSVVDP